MDRPEMELPKPADFEDARAKIRPKITAERVTVLVLLLLGGAFLGLATEFWPAGGLEGLVQPVRAALLQNDVDELRMEIRRNLQMGRTRQALLLADRLLEIDEEVGRLERARVYSIEREFDKAGADLDAALARNPKNAEALYLRAAIRVRMKDLDAALADATTLAEVEPREGLLLRSQIYREQKDYTKAIADLNEVIESDPAYLPAYEHRYQIHLDQDAIEEALADAATIAETAPARGLVLKGDAYAKQQKYDESIQAYTEAIEADPRNATAYNNRAYHRLLLRREVDAAMEDVEMAIALSGEEPAYVDTRGYASYLRGDMKGALQDFNTAIRGVEEQGIDPEFSAEIYFHRALVYRKLGEEELAEKDFARAKEYGFEWTELPEPVSDDEL